MKFNRPLSVILGTAGPNKTFFSTEEVADWVAKEKEFWKWVEEKEVLSYTSHHIINEIRSAINNPLNNILHHNTQYPQTQNIDNIQSVFFIYHNNKNAAYKAITSDSQEAIYARSLYEKDKRRALHFLRGSLVNPQNIGIQGAFDVLTLIEETLFQTGIREKGNYSSEYKKLSTEYANSIDNANTQINALQNQLEMQADQHSRNQEKYSNEFKVAESNRTISFQTIEETYNKKVQLSSPVLYWNNKSKRHSNASIYWGVTAAILFLITLIGIIIGADYMHSEIQKDNSAYWLVGYSITCTVLMVWLIRIILRFLLSNLHQRDDAKFRVTLIKTYLSLSKNSSITAEQNNYMLDSIFRPLSDGLVKDDALPLSVIETILKKK